MSKCYTWLVVLAVFFFGSAAGSGQEIQSWSLEELQFETDESVEELWEEWLEVGRYITMVTPDGEVIMTTGRRVFEGDQYLAHDNVLYEVVDVDEETAYTKSLGEVQLPDKRFGLNEIRSQLGLTVAEAQEGEDGGSTGTIAIFHTHNAESYVPTDGTHSIDGKGGIHAVGAAFSNALNTLGVSTDYSEALHLPHDRGAYRRSRNTVLELLARDPDAIFDVHRDAAPRDAYAAQIGGDWVTQIQFVVGRQNQNLGINRQYATSLKRIGDEVHPGLIKGIFFASGNYNQDLTPLNLLLEVGAHTNSRDAAKRGIELFADVVDFYFYGPREQREAQNGIETTGARAASRTIVWIAVLVVAGLGAFFVVNAGGFAGALSRLRRR